MTRLEISAKLKRASKLYNAKRAQTKKEKVENPRIEFNQSFLFLTVMETISDAL